MVKQEDPRVTAEHWKGLYEALAVVVEAQQRANDRLRAKNEALAERCERLEGALRDMVERITYYAELKEEGIPNIEDWAYTYHSGDMNRARAALSPSSGGGE
jgi:hypothetical protein